MLVGLSTCLAIRQLLNKEKEKSFTTELIQIDTTLITSIEISPPEGGAPFRLQKESSQWFVTRNGLSIKARPAAVAALISSLGSITTNDIATSRPEEWVEFGLAQGRARKISVLSQDKVLESFYVGNFSENPPPQPTTFYLRINGEEEVYTVESAQGRTLDWPYRNFRNAHLMRTNPEVNFTAFSIDFGDTLLLARKTEQGWQNQQDASLDSLAVEQYLNVFRNLSDTTFIDNFDEMAASFLPQQTILLEGDELQEPVEIRLFHDTTRLEFPIIIRSSYNPNTYFGSDSSGMYRKIITVPFDFLQE